MDKITLIAYKSDSYYSCKGCVMASYSSGFIFKEYTDNMEALIEDLSNLAIKEYAYQENSYMIWLIYNGDTIISEVDDSTSSLSAHSNYCEGDPQTKLLDEIDIKRSIRIKEKIEAREILKK